MAWVLALLVLAVLTVVKPLGSVPYLGPLLLTGAAFLQLYLPLWRVDRRGWPMAAVGLHLRGWPRELGRVALVSAVTLPLYAWAHHWYLTGAHDLALAWGFTDLARWIPKARLNLDMPVGGVNGARIGWFLEISATHFLGVALPEETFYRGYLQTQLQRRWPPRFRVAGVPLGRAVWVTSALFALGHFLGEWNPLRLGPFFPSLLFGWLRNASGSVVGAIVFHGICNIFGELLFTFYRG